LSTLPALESVSFSAPEVRQADESTLALSESLTELLRLPTLRLVRFNNFSFTPALFQATANAFMEGTAVTELEFMVCSFSAVECDFMMANGFSRIASVTSIIAHKCKNTIALVDALAAVLPLNSTLRHLELGQRSDDDPGCLSPLFLALGHNTGLKTLTIFMQGSAEDSLCTAINVGLRMNETLESLRLYSAPLSDDNADSWCSAFSFLRTNKTLKSLGFYVRYGLTESCLSAFRIDIAVMLEDNASLGSLSIQAVNSSKMKAQDYVAFVTALKHNGTLKTLILQPHFTIQLTDDEDKHVAKFLKKNYALESVPGIDLENRAGDVGAILRLNAAGRRHLVQDGSSISKGVKVLSSVNDDNNCVFLHLLENPRLCDRTAVELPDADESSSHSTSPTAIYSSGGEKREQDILHGGKESRRRLA
jgi:hypothetical protein